MRSLMLRSLTVATLLSTSLFANSYDNELLKFEIKRVKHAVARIQGKVNSVSIALKRDLHQDGWNGYVFNLDLSIQGKNMIQKDILFAKGDLIAPELINLKTKMSFKEELYPTLTDKYYDKKHLIAGNFDAEHKIVLFSDPLCPICLDEVPHLIKAVKEHPDQFALFYYAMPLNMHPTARTMVKAAIVAKSLGVKDIDYKLYNENRKYFNLSTPYYDQYEEKDDKKALKYFNKIFNTNISMDQLNSKDIEDEVIYDLQMAESAFVQGTPTIYFDSEIDKTRSKYKKYIK